MYINAYNTTALLCEYVAHLREKEQEREREREEKLSYGMCAPSLYHHIQTIIVCYSSLSSLFSNSFDNLT